MAGEYHRKIKSRQLVGSYEGIIRGLLRNEVKV